MPFVVTILRATIPFSKNAKDKSKRFMICTFLNGQTFLLYVINACNKNRYALEYLLSDKEKIKTMSNFNFMGNQDERIIELEKQLEELNNIKKS